MIDNQKLVRTHEKNINILHDTNAISSHSIPSLEASKNASEASSDLNQSPQPPNQHQATPAPLIGRPTKHKRTMDTINFESTVQYERVDDTVARHLAGLHKHNVFGSESCGSRTTTPRGTNKGTSLSSELGGAPGAAMSPSQSWSPQQRYIQLQSMWVNVTNGLVRRAVTSWRQHTSAGAHVNHHRIGPTNLTDLVTVYEPTTLDVSIETRRWHCHQLCVNLFGRSAGVRARLRPTTLSRGIAGREFLARCPIDVHLGDDVSIESIMVMSSARDVDVMGMNPDTEVFESLGGDRVVACEANGLCCVCIDTRRKYLNGGRGGVTSVTSLLRVQCLGAEAVDLCGIYFFASPGAELEEGDRGLHVQRDF
eukprot:PhM_4_TR4059/c0_g1_i1/m.99512